MARGSVSVPLPEPLKVLFVHNDTIRPQTPDGPVQRTVAGLREALRPCYEIVPAYHEFQALKPETFPPVECDQRIVLLLHAGVSRLLLRDSRGLSGLIASLKANCHGSSVD